MPAELTVVVIGVLAAFGVFSATLMWADRRTR